MLCLLLLTFAVTFLVAPSETDEQRTCFDWATHISATEFKASFQSLQPGTTNPGRPFSENEGPQLRQAPDAAMQASVVPTAPGLICLLIVLHLWINREFSLSTNPTRQSPFHKILFRVTVAPNAP